MWNWKLCVCQIFKEWTLDLEQWHGWCCLRDSCSRLKIGCMKYFLCCADNKIRLLRNFAKRVIMIAFMKNVWAKRKGCEKLPPLVLANQMPYFWNGRSYGLWLPCPNGPLTHYITLICGFSTSPLLNNKLWPLTVKIEEEMLWTAIPLEPQKLKFYYFDVTIIHHLNKYARLMMKVLPCDKQLELWPFV